MSDPVLPNQQDIGALVLQAPETIWKKIKKALGAQTREQAAAIVQADGKARKKVMDLLFGSAGTMLNLRPGARADSFINTPVKPLISPEERIYGTEKAKVTF